MCKAFVKLPRPFGDQSGGARKWAIRDGCQEWFRGGAYRPPTTTGKAKNGLGGSVILGGPHNTRSKNKELALGRIKDEPESPVWNSGGGPSSGKPWDPEASPHPYQGDPTYNTYPLSPFTQQQQVVSSHPSVPSQHTKHYSTGSSNSGLGSTSSGLSAGQFAPPPYHSPHQSYYAQAQQQAQQQQQYASWGDYGHSPNVSSHSMSGQSSQVSPHAQHQPLHPTHHDNHYPPQHEAQWRVASAASGGGGGGNNNSSSNGANGHGGPNGNSNGSGGGNSGLTGGGAAGNTLPPVNSAAQQAFDTRTRTSTLSTDVDAGASPKQQHAYHLPSADGMPGSGSPGSSHLGSPNDN